MRLFIKREKTMKKLLLMTCGIAASVAFGAATTNEGGEYTYPSWQDDNRTTGQTGDQIWNVTSPLSLGKFWPGQTDEVDYWQIYRGASITTTVSSLDRIMKGNVIFENNIVWAGTENYIGLTGPTRLVLRNGGSLTVSGDDLRIGQKHGNDYANTHGALFMEEPSALTTVGKNAVVGNTRPGAIWMDGGVLSITNGVLKTGGYSGQDGYIRINGGDVSLGSGNADFLNIGCAANYGSLHISGGVFSTRRTGGVAGDVYGKVGLYANKSADIYVDGGLLDLWNERFGLGYWNATGTTGGRASLTVDGDGRAVVSIVALGRTGSGNASVINLNGGRLEIIHSTGFATYGNTGNSRYVNFDGGTLALVKDPRLSSMHGALTSDGEKVVYPGGGTIEVPSGITANIKVNSMRKAVGFGIKEITLTNPGSGYVTAPEVKLVGGSGSGVSAYAIMNKDRSINRIVVTCRGEGYAEGDSVTVSIVSTTGSGAEATATLASNDGGIIRKTGAGTWRQQEKDNPFDGEIEIAEGKLAVSNAGFTAASAIRMGEGTAVAPVRGGISSLNRLDVTNGVVTIAATGSSGTAELTIGELSVDHGLALVTHTNDLALALASTDLTSTSSSASPVVNGLVYANKDASAYRNPSLFERAEDGSLSLVKTTTAAVPGENDNWKPASSVSATDAPEVSAVNSIIMQLTPVECYLRNSGNIEVKSGMIVCQRPHSYHGGAIRIEVTGGGAFTTRAKNGMFIYGDNYLAGQRSNSTANDGIVNNGNLWRRYYGPFADPDENTPMTLTVAGEKQARPELGAQAWLMKDQTFSGGLNLVNGGVFIQSDAGLGASGSPIRASGYCSIASYGENTLSISRPIQLIDGSALIFSPSMATGNAVSGELSGSGDLLTSDVNRGGCAMAFTGDHSSFTGDYYIQGNARISPATFSMHAGICLADGTNGIGVIETSGTFTHSVGTGKGELCWKRFKAYPESYALRGGFAAFGGDLTVNLGGAGAKLLPGSAYLPDGAVIQLQSQYADSTLTFANGFELDGKTQRINVWKGKSAILSGTVSDSVSGGALAVTGNIDFAGVLEVSAANIASGAAMVTVNGDLAFSGAKVELPASVTPETLEAYKDTGIVLFTATGNVMGCPVLEAPGLDGMWNLRSKRNGAVSLVRSKGTVVVFR